jgi:hypothetical protein
VEKKEKENKEVNLSSEEEEAHENKYSHIGKAKLKKKRLEQLQKMLNFLSPKRYSKF